MAGLTQTFASPTLQDKAAVRQEPHKSARRANFGTRRRWSLRAAIPLWIGLAVAGWAAVVVSVYSVVRHENEVAVIEKIEHPDRQLVGGGAADPSSPVAREDIDRVNTVAPAAGPEKTRDQTRR